MTRPKNRLDSNLNARSLGELSVLRKSLKAKNDRQELAHLIATQNDEIPRDAPIARRELASEIRRGGKLRYAGWLTGGENASDPAYNFGNYTIGDTHGKWQSLVEPMPDNKCKRR